MLWMLVVVIVFVAFIAVLVRASRRLPPSARCGDWDPGYSTSLASDVGSCSPEPGADADCSSVDSSSDSGPGGDCGGGDSSTD